MAISALHRELVSIAVGLVALGVGVAALAAEVVTVVQRDRNFQTPAITIAAGDTVRITNEDPFIHQLYTETSQFSFDTGEQQTGQDMLVEFPVAGTYEVRCRIHPRMLLAVTVQ